jgi:hypothetical protein
VKRFSFLLSAFCFFPMYTSPRHAHPIARFEATVRHDS